MAKIKVKMFHIDSNYYCKVDSIKHCCSGFEKHYGRNIMLGYIYEEDFPVPGIGIINNPGVHQDSDYVMDWEFECEVLQLEDPELEYDLSIINYCPYCGEKIEIDIFKEEIPVEANDLIKFLNANNKERRKIKMVGKNGKPLTIDEAYLRLAEVVGKAPYDCDYEFINVVKEDIIKY